VVETTLPSIQEEVAELEPTKVLKSRTRGGTSEAASTQPRPRISKKRRTVRKLKESQYIKDESCNAHLDYFNYLIYLKSLEYIYIFYEM